MTFHVYVSNSGSEHLSYFRLDGATGKLDAGADITLASAPGALATDAPGERMFVSLRAEKKFGSYDIDRATGALKNIGSVEVPDGSPYLCTDSTDRFLLASYYGAGHVSVHAIAADGSLSAEPLQWIPTDGHAHSIQTDPSNRFAFVPHTNPANAIYQFRFDENTGALQANEPPLLQPATPEGPRHFVFHPQQDVFYSVNENGSTVSAHRFDSEQGTLSSFQVISTLPGGRAVEGNTTAEITISGDGRHLYASNRGHDSLVLFDVGDNGTLRAKDYFSTEATPRFFDLDPTGAWLLAAGERSGRVAVYAVNKESGALSQTQTVEVGDRPLWIEFVEAA